MKHMTEVGRVAVFPSVGYLFEYIIERNVPIGARVKVRLGHRTCYGILVARGQATVATNKLRAVDEVIDSESVISPALLDLTNWMAGYYQSTLDKSLFIALPAAIRQGKPIQANELWHACDGADESESTALANAPKQAALLALLRSSGTLDKTALDAAIPNWRQSMNGLATKGLVSDQLPAPPPVKTTPLPTLTAEQEAAVEMVRPQTFGCYVLDGITGSGKTEVYLRLAQRVVNEGRQVLMLVPEIGLVGKLLARAQAAFGTHRVLPYHSGLSDGERARAWGAAHLKQAAVIVGTRSATFIPLPDLALVVVDEEHDESYKEREVSLHYHARDVVIKRAQTLNCPVMLGSSTPALETLWNIQRGRYQCHRLRQRYAKARLPKVEVIDVRGIRMEAGLSPRLLTLVRECLARDEQALLFLNRRGYAPRLLCHACGAVPECPRCDLPLVWHKYDETLRCHHCRRYVPVPERCAQCDKPTLHPVGQGTEHVEEFMRGAFPDIPVVRVDTDSVRRRHELEKRLRQLDQSGPRVLIGTQIIAKGHHFPRVTQVGIIDADRRFLATDFRAVERLGQLIVQVSGRAGRAALPGHVALQTHYPDHPMLRKLLRDGYESFASDLLAERKALALPPFRSLAVIRASSRQPEVALRFLEGAYRQLQKSENKRVDVHPPMPAVLERIDGRYRARLLLMANRRGDLHACLSGARPKFEYLKLARRVRWHIDVDPLEVE